VQIIYGLKIEILLYCIDWFSLVSIRQTDIT
jgi:hypothetical protein